MRTPIKRLHNCSFCTDDNGHAKIGFIFPEDTLAHREADGRYKCRTCIDREIKDRIVRVTPNSIRGRELIAEDKYDYI